MGRIEVSRIFNVFNLSLYILITNLSNTCKPLVRALTITRGGEVYILGDDCIMQLDPADLNVKRVLEFESILWCSDNPMNLSARDGGERFELRCKGCFPIKYRISEETGRL